MGNKGGLQGVVVADVWSSLVDGENGRLIYAGYEIEDLAANALFEDVAFLLWHNRLPNAEELEALRSEIAKEAVVPSEIIAMMKALPKDAEPMAVLRTVVSALAHYDADSESMDKAVALKKSIRLTGQITTLCAAWDRIRKGKEPIAPRQDLNLSQNFIYMLQGESEPNKVASDAVNVYMVLLAEHGMNASTFAGRVVTATGADMHSAVVGAIGALKGPSHGGANAEAMRQFVEIGEIENVKPWFDKYIVTGEKRIMGIGHRIYKALDPRADILYKHAGDLARSSGNEKWFTIADELAKLARANEYFIERKLYPNVDYYSAILLYTLDLDIDMFTPLFAMSRIAGWTTNIIDQMSGRLIRPDANYIGNMGLKWVPVSER